VTDLAAQTPPHSRELETAVLSAWMIHDRFGDAWVPQPDLFYVPAHRSIAAAMAKLEKGARDQASLLAQLDTDGTLARIGGAGAVYQVLAGAPSYGDPWPHVHRLRELKALREALRAIQANIAEAFEHKNLGAFVAHTQESVRDASSDLGTELYTPADLMWTVAQDFSARKSATWFRTGLPTVDNSIGGLQSGHVTVVGAATNFGKSALGLMLADRLLQDSKRPLILAFEDAPSLYGRRLLARRAGVSPSILRRPETVSENSPAWSKVAVAANGAERVKFFMKCIGKTVERVATDLQCVLASEDIDLIIVDYLQAVKCSQRQQDRRNEVAYVARTFCDTIKSADKAGVLFSQIKRLPPGQRPTMHDLKEAGDVENMAENVLVGWCDRDATHRIFVAKAKDGIGGAQFGLQWDNESCSFSGELEEAA
jgi:replicative DNA helicase